MTFEAEAPPSAVRNSLGGARIDLEPQNQKQEKKVVAGWIPGFHVADFSEVSMGFERGAVGKGWRNMGIERGGR